MIDTWEAIDCNVGYHVSSTQSIGEIVDALAERGCLDLTSSINLTTASNRPTAGGGLSDVYRGALHDGTKIAIKSLRVYESSPFERGSRGQKVLKVGLIEGL